MLYITNIKLNGMSINPNILLPAQLLSCLLPKGKIMTSFVQLNYSKTHPGVARLEAVIDLMQRSFSGFSGTRGLAKLFLSAVVAAVMVVAYQVMDSVAEGHLLLMWLALWAVAFAALAVLSQSASHLAARLMGHADRASRGFSKARLDWATAGKHADHS
jgi:hypothetical protein